MAQKLFDKASLVMIPSQYKEGKIYNIKPEDQSSSFEFERGSAATRVNSSGLIEQTGVSSTQLWNGDSVYLNGTASYNNGIVTFTASVNNDYILFQNLEGVEQSNYYEISFDTVVNSGSFSLLQGTGSSFVPNYLINETGSYKRIVQYTHATPHQILFWSSNSSSLGAQFDGTISNISIKKVNLDTPRLDYSGTEPALLLEPQRTNELPYSENFEGFSNKTNSIITSNASVSPDGLQNATRIQGAGLWRLRDLVSSTVGNTASVSVWVKAVNENEKNQFVISAGGGLNSNVFTATSQWQRFEFTKDSIEGGFCGLADTSQQEVDLYVWGMQVELASYATSYIPTNGQAETRLNDSCNNANITDFQTTDASIFVEFDYDPSKKGGFRAVFSTENSTASNFDLIILTSDSNGTLFKFDVSGSGISFSTFTPLNGKNKALIKFNRSNGTVKTYLNGSQVDSATATAIPEIHKISVGGRLNAFSGFSIDRQLGDGVSYFTIFPTELTDQECINLTTI